MAKYVDGFVINVPKKRLAEYKKIAKIASKVWKEHGALEYMETVGEDMNPPFGKPFPKLAGSKSDEVVIFSWITYKSKSERNKINKLVMNDPRMRMDGKTEKDMPFDMKRMAYGGFKTLVER
jgi:alkaline phosphatase